MAQEHVDAAKGYLDRLTELHGFVTGIQEDAASDLNDPELDDELDGVGDAILEVMKFLKERIGE